ncbi:MAG: hypothetical protein SNI05_05970, partial [Rikenellaceae bacterium]
MAKKKHFLFIPIQLLKTLIEDRNIVDTMFDVGIYQSALRINVDKDAAYKQFVYCLYKHPTQLTDDLLQEQRRMDDFPFDEDYNGFGSGCDTEFAPEDEISYLEQYAGNNPAFEELLMEWYMVYKMYNLLELKPETVKYTIKNVKKTEYDTILDKCVYALLNGEVMYNISRDSALQTNKERVLWAMYMGIISIIGNKDYAQTTSSLIKCRMFGAKSSKELELWRKDKEFDKLYNTYTTKHKYHKYLNILQDQGMITEIGLKRRTYVSFKYSSPKELALAIKEKEVNSRPLKTVQCIELQQIKHQIVLRYLQVFVSLRYKTC